MFKRMLILTITLFVCASIQAQAIEFFLSSFDVVSGGDYTIQVEVSDIPSPPEGLYSEEMRFQYDATKCTGVDVSNGPATSGWSLLDHVDDGGTPIATHTYSDVNFSTGTYTEGILHYITFEGVTDDFTITVVYFKYALMIDGTTPGPETNYPLDICPCTPPSEPLSFTATALDCHRIKLEWVAPTTGDEPITYYITSPEAGDEDAISGLEYIYVGLTEDTPYTFSIYAHNDCDGGSDSPTVGPISESTPVCSGWRMPITASISLCDLTADAELGMDEMATDGFDFTFDVFLPPLPPTGEHIFAYFPHPEWGEPLGDNYTSDIRNLVTIPDGDVVTWDMLVSKTSPCNDCEIEFDPSEVPPAYQVILVDNDLGGFMQDLRLDNTYDCDFSSAPTEPENRSLTVLVGSLPGIYNPGWNMVSIPIYPIPNSPAGFYGDDVIPPCYFFVYGYDPITGGYYNPITLREVEGYWLGLSCRTIVEASGTEVFLPYEYTLYPGANMVGAPFGQWSKEEVIISYGGIEYAGFSAAAAPGVNLISPTMWHWDSYIEDYIETDYFIPWLSNWVFANEQCKIIFPDFGTRYCRKRINTVDCDYNWRLNFNVSRDDVSDNTAHLGVTLDASDDFDCLYDYPEPPPPPDERVDYITAYFPHPEWGEPIADDFDSDIKQTIPCGKKTWNMTIYSKNTGTVNLAWKFAMLSEDYDILTITDLSEGVEINLLTGSSYSYPTMAGVLRNFVIRADCSVLANESSNFKPKELMVLTEPNPFNSACRISAPVNATVEIFDIKGRCIVELDGGDQIWKPEASVGSGVYLVRAKIGDEDITKRVVYLK